MNVLKRSDVGEGAEDMKEVDDLHFSEIYHRIDTNKNNN
jgi:hypothetical protein